MKLQYFIFDKSGNTLIESALIEISAEEIASRIADDFYAEKENRDLGLVLIDLENKKELYNSKGDRNNGKNA